MEGPDQEAPYRPPEWEAEESVVPGISRGEFEELAENIRWIDGLTLTRKLEFIRRGQRRIRELHRLGARLGG
jgi:hypothetical protein